MTNFPVKTYTLKMVVDALRIVIKEIKIKILFDFLYFESA